MACFQPKSQEWSVIKGVFSSPLQALKNAEYKIIQKNNSLVELLKTHTDHTQN